MPQPTALFDLAEKFHLLPIVLWFVFVGLFHTLTMLVSFGFRCASEVVDYFYDFKMRCAESKRRYEQRISAYDPRPAYPEHAIKLHSDGDTIRG